ncbi:MAG TPA: NAD(+) diphosphatase [Steroidobacteraceae bacterium]|nr:NAD(+) diphosphatase [Steroidobacteraceae bacterium]
MPRRNVFAGPYMDRDGHLRGDPQWFERALADPASRLVPIWNSRNLLTTTDPPRAALIEREPPGGEPPSPEELILLGRFEDRPCFAWEVESAEPPVLAPDTRFEDLRLVASLLPAGDAGLLGYARAMITWRHRHRFCGSCGAPTSAAKGGHVRVCSNPDCPHESFPRLDPAIIVLVSDEDRALLGRQAAWPAGRYSTIAGFVEPGESLEDAVAREVYEETGIRVDRIEYHSSQPWPFPSSLMLGFTARALSRQIDLRDCELEDARWFSRADLADGVPLLPPPQSISYRLIEDWFDAGAERPLRELRAARKS